MFSTIFIVSSICSISTMNIIWSKNVIPAEIQSKQCREYTKTHYKPILIIAKQWITLGSIRIWYWFLSSPIRSLWYTLLSPWIFWISFSINGCQRIYWYPTLTDWTKHVFSRLIYPLEYTSPTIKVTTFCDNWFISCV